MDNFLKEVLHMEVNSEEAADLYEHLPLLYKGLYTIFRVNTGGVEWIAMKPKADVRLTQMRKNRAYLEQMQQINVAMFLDKASLYSKEKMTEEGMPFVIKGDAVYLPFLGILLGKKQRELKPIHQISFLTQKILIMGLYEGFDRAAVSYLAKRLNVSKMAISKSFDEIEYLNIGVMDNDGRRRAITVQKSKKSAWDKIRPFLRNPVIRAFNLSEDARLPKKAGISALSEYSLLEDNNYPTYAIEKKDIAASGIREMKEAGRDTDIGCRVFELGYFIDCIKKDVQDPLSVVLTVRDETDDERVEASVEQMLKEYVW
ncbi:MAG: hypothetical protein K6B54_00355 [Clostridia bacterium]|nr:hypothetical protein [Clostridia bacterium]